MKGKTFRGMGKPEVLPEGQFLLVVPNILTTQLCDEAKISLKVGVWTILILPTAPGPAKKIWSLFSRKAAQKDKSVLLIVSYSVRVLNRLIDIALLI